MRLLLKSITARDGAIHSLSAANNTFPREYEWNLEKDTPENRAMWKSLIEGAVVIPLASCERSTFIRSLGITHYWNGEPFDAAHRKAWRESSL